MKLVFATHNRHKLDEVAAILPPDIELVSLSDLDCFEDIPETAETLRENAMQKARYVYERYGLNCFADDTGLEVEALNGAPGVRTARFAGEHCSSSDNVDKLLRVLDGATNRRACFKTTIALILDGEDHYFDGKVDGLIATERLGEGGFGYDPVFCPIETGLSFSQMGVAEKNRISHRARAVQALVDFLHHRS